MAEAYCYNCKWCRVLELKSGKYIQVCINDVDGECLNEVGYLSAGCGGYESDYEEDDEYEAD